MLKRKKWFSMILAGALGVSVMMGSLSVKAEEQTKKKHVVVLDPGHGGSDDGAVETFGKVTYKESEITWKLANYTKQELAKRADIEVYLTRKKNQNLTIKRRVEVAKAYGADILVSQHINDSDNVLAHGASVLISKGTYRPAIARKEKLFGKYVMEELGSIGLYKRFPETGGMEYRMSESGEKYPNGKPRDYYGIVAYSVEAKMPGVIIEHAFLSNKSDVKNYLSSNAKIRKLAVADANAIIRYCDQLPDDSDEDDTPDPARKNGWIQEDGEYYYYKNDIKQKNCLLTLDEGIYYVDEEGKRQYGWQEVQGKQYFFQENGVAQTGWFSENGSWYYFNSKYAYLYKDVALVSGSGNVYIFDKEGKRYSGWFDFNGERYYAGEQGYAYRGMKEVDGKWYFFDTKDAFLYKNKLITLTNGGLYFFDKEGVRFNQGFKTLKSGGKTNTYYFQKNGKAKKGWLKVSGKWYCFNRKNGIMYKSCTMKSSTGVKYKFNAKGVCTNRK